jgi:hypothetical protein
MPGPANFLDDVANDLAQWIDQTADQVALAFAPGRAPFSANISEEKKLEYYRAQLFNPDGSPNAVGREAEFKRLGPQGFAQVYRALIARYPELRVPTPPPLAVPEEWPQAPMLPPGAPMPPGPGGPPGPPPGAVAPPPGRPGLPAVAPSIPPGAPGPMLPRPSPRPPMMPPIPMRR